MYATTYTIEPGRKQRQYTIRLIFEPADFPHLSGIQQYARDIDFGLRRSEYFGARMIDAIVSGRLDEQRLSKSRNWERIRGRLAAIVSLQQTLEGPFTIAKFSPERVRGISKINAEYVLKNKRSGEVFFLFFDERSGHYYCTSAFCGGVIDYTEDQQKMTVLQVTKSTDGGEAVLYRYAGYREKEALTI